MLTDSYHLTELISYNLAILKFSPKSFILFKVLGFYLHITAISACSIHLILHILFVLLGKIQQNVNLNTKMFDEFPFSFV